MGVVHPALTTNLLRFMDISYIRFEKLHENMQVYNIK